MDRASRAIVSPEGNNVYVITHFNNTIAIFNRNISNGSLSFNGMVINGINGVSGLNRISSIIISPDGEYLYALGSSDDSLVLFKRNAENGSLSFVTEYRNGESDIPGLDGSTDLAISADGKNIYLVSMSLQALVVLKRKSSNGSLSVLEHYDNEEYGFSGLNGACSVTVAQDGHNIYIASGNDNALTVYARNPEDGRLLYDTFFVHGYAGIDALENASDVIVAPDGDNVYVYSIGSMSISNFVRSRR